MLAEVAQTLRFNPMFATEDDLARSLTSIDPQVASRIWLERIWSLSTRRADVLGSLRAGAQFVEASGGPYLVDAIVDTILRSARDWPGPVPALRGTLSAA